MRLYKQLRKDLILARDMRAVERMRIP